MRAIDRGRTLLRTTPGVVSDAVFRRFGVSADAAHRAAKTLGLPVVRVSKLGYRVIIEKGVDGGS